MKKIKIIKAINLQVEIDKWIKEDKPNIISTSLSTTIMQNGNIQNAISIVYEEKPIIDRNKVIKGPTIKKEK